MRRRKLSQANKKAPAATDALEPVLSFSIAPQGNPTQAEGLLSIPEAAKRFGLPAKTLYKLCRREDFPVIKLSSHAFYLHPTVLARWLAADAPRLGVLTGRRAAGPDQGGERW